MQDNQQDNSFLSTSFGQTLSNSSLRNDPMTRDNITQAEEMALNQIASDDQILRIVNDGAGTTSNATPNGRSMSLGDVLEQRISDLEALQNAAETASKEGREGPSWTESNQYDLDFYKSILYENPDARPEDRITYPRFSQLEISDCVNYTATGVSEVSQKEYTAYTKMATFQFPEDSTRYVTYAGTGPEVTSWLEDGRMATTASGVQAQKAASEYLNRVMKEYSGDDFIVAGYSKGGNEALYAGIMLNDDDRKRLYKLRNFDGPGMGSELLENETFTDQYKKLKEHLGDKLYCLSPQNSFVGHLMNNHDTYVYFQSCDKDLSSGMMAHVYKNWVFNADGSLVTADADGNPLQRTELSEFYESLLENLLAVLTPEQTERFYDMLEKLCVDNEIVGLWELNKLCTKDGKFDLDTLCNVVVSFAASLDNEDLNVLATIVDTIITTNNLSYFLELLAEYTTKSVGFEWNGFLRGAVDALNRRWVSKIDLAPVLKVLVAALSTLVVGAAAVYVGVKWVVENAGSMIEKLRLTVSELCEKFLANLDSVWAKAEQMIVRIKTRLSQAAQGLYQNIQAIMAAPNAVEALRIALQQSKEIVVGAADKIGQTVQTVLRTTVEKIDQGFQAGESFFNSIFDGCKLLFRQTKEHFSSMAGGLSVRASRYVSLDIDKDGLMETVHLLNKAAQHAEGLGSRVGSICGRLAREGAVDALTGNFISLISSCHVVVARLQVSHYGEIVSMAGKVERICTAYENAKRQICVALSRLNG